MAREKLGKSAVTVRKTKRGAGRPKEPVGKEKILEIAGPLFIEQGFNGTSLDEIARAVNVAKPTLLYHFESKEKLYLAVMDAYVSDLLKLVVEAVIGLGSFEERLVRLGDVLVEYLGNHPPVARLLLRDAIDNGPFVSQDGQAKVQHTLDLTFRFLRTGITQSSMDDGAIRNLVMSIIGMHLLYYSIPDITSRYLGRSVFDPESIEARKIAVRQHVVLLLQQHVQGIAAPAQ